MREMQISRSQFILSFEGLVIDGFHPTSAGDNNKSVEETVKEHLTKTKEALMEIGWNLYYGDYVGGYGNMRCSVIISWHFNGQPQFDEKARHLNRLGLQWGGLAQFGESNLGWAGN